MLREDIEAVIFKQSGFDRLSRATIGGSSSFNISEITRIDFSEETKVCRFHHENGSMTILANTDYLMLRTKSTEEE